MEVIDRMAKLCKIGADEISSLKKICKLSDSTLDKLVDMLVKYEFYETLDVEEFAKKKKKTVYEKLKLTNLQFNKLGRCTEDYILATADKVIRKEISFISFLEGHHKLIKVQKVLETLRVLSGYDSEEQLRSTYPSETSPNALEDFIGAEVKGDKLNLQAVLLKNYWKGVLIVDAGGKEEKVQFKCLENIRDSLDTFANYDHVILQSSSQHEDLNNSLFNLIFSSGKPTSCLLLVSSELSQFKVLTVLRNKFSSKSDLEIVPLNFLIENTKSGGRVVENSLPGILFGKLSESTLQIKRFYKDLSEIIELVNNSKILFVSDESSFVRVHSQDLINTVTYLGPKLALDQLKDKLRGEREFNTEEQQAAKEFDGSLPLFNSTIYGHDESLNSTTPLDDSLPTTSPQKYPESRSLLDNSSDSGVSSSAGTSKNLDNIRYSPDMFATQAF